MQFFSLGNRRAMAPPVPFRLSRAVAVWPEFALVIKNHTYHPD